MLGYIFLFITVLIGVSKGYCGKKTSEFISGITDGLLLQSIRALLCVVIGGILFVSSGKAAQIDKTVLIISFLNGLSNAAFLLSWLFAVRSGAYLFVDMCLTAGGILVPCIGSMILPGSSISLLQYIGITVMLIAIFVMSGYNSTITKKNEFHRYFIAFVRNIIKRPDGTVRKTVY